MGVSPEDHADLDPEKYGAKYDAVVKNVRKKIIDDLEVALKPNGDNVIDSEAALDKYRNCKSNFRIVASPDLMANKAASILKDARDKLNKVNTDKAEESAKNEITALIDGWIPDRYKDKRKVFGTRSTRKFAAILNNFKDKLPHS